MLSQVSQDPAHGSAEQSGVSRLESSFQSVPVWKTAEMSIVSSSPLSEILETWVAPSLVSLRFSFASKNCAYRISRLVLRQFPTKESKRRRYAHITASASFKLSRRLPTVHKAKNAFKKAATEAMNPKGEKILLEKEALRILGLNSAKYASFSKFHLTKGSIYL